MWTNFRVAENPFSIRSSHILNVSAWYGQLTGTDPSFLKLRCHLTVETLCLRPWERLRVHRKLSFRRRRKLNVAATADC